MAQRSGSGWVWAVAGLTTLCVLLSQRQPVAAPPAQVPVARETSAPQAAAPVPKLSSADLLFVARRLLLLTHTGQFRSRDLHARALAMLELIEPGTPESTEAAQLKGGIAAAYAGNGATAPTPDRTPLPADLVRALPGPIAIGSHPVSGQHASTGTAIAKPTRSPMPSGSVSGDALSKALLRTDPVPELDEVARGDALPRTPTPSIPQPVTGLGCEENGSCYGDISAATGHPKTVEVHGYYRSNGTYVRGHYRSK